MLLFLESFASGFITCLVIGYIIELGKETKKNERITGNRRHKQTYSNNR